ncbi:probable serine/threonine-protein kinase PBL19 [Tanacetum coccineum]
MVFPFRCFSMSYVTHDDTSVPGNTTFFSVYTSFTERRSGTRPSSQNVPDTIPEYPTTLRAFKLAELNLATSNFNQSTMIGKGGFGNVHKGIIQSLENPSVDVSVAVKRGKRGPQERRQWETEVKILGEVKHPNLVELVGYCNEDSKDESNCLLVYEYMPNGSLDDHLSGKSNIYLSWSMRLKIAKDAATGLIYLHEGMGVDRQLIFRDFKPSNILLDRQMNAKLSDFGFARQGPQDGRTHISTATVVGTKGYAAPEYVQTGRLTAKIDVWSYGIFLKELITGRRPVAQKTPGNKPECMRWVCCSAGVGKSKPVVDPRLEGRYSERSVQKVSSIADKCLIKDPKLRPTMSEVLNMLNEAIQLDNQQPPNGGQT